MKPVVIQPLELKQLHPQAILLLNFAESDINWKDIHQLQGHWIVFNDSIKVCDNKHFCCPSMQNGILNTFYCIKLPIKDIFEEVSTRD